jgi:hypothetical protein
VEVRLPWTGDMESIWFAAVGAPHRSDYLSLPPEMLADIYSARGSNLGGRMIFQMHVQHIPLSAAVKRFFGV